MPAADVLVVTGGPDMPVPDPEAQAVADAVSAAGVPARVVSWTEDVAWADARLVLVRSPWDYTLHRPAFLAWAEGVATVTRLVNPVEVLRWNSHKGYLAELERAGVPSVPTVLVRSGAHPDSVPPVRGDDAGVVVKPAVSAGAHGTFRHARREDALPALQALLAEGDALVQPYLPDVQQGERSLIYLGGELSHAVTKRPAAGDFRVQQHHGGSTEPWEASAQERAVAEEALALAPGDHPLLYARVDLLGPAEEPVLIELELIEPFLFLDHAPGALARLAGLVAGAARAG